MAVFEPDDSGSASADSFNSAHLYESSSSSSDGGEKDKGELDSDGIDTGKQIRAQKKADRRRDKYMKDVEKRFVRTQGIKGFNKERMSKKAKNEGDRTKILTQMIFNDMQEKGDARTKQTLEMQSQTDEERKKNRKLLLA